jgi:D-3-phosphoglycerate dehydrogenase / 2-oxoglutarate reductase
MSDIFDGGAFVGVINAPDLGAVASLPEIVPYVMLAERMGSMQAQLLKSNKIGSITLNLRGKDIADTKLTDVMKSAVLCGALRELTAQPITYVNAISVAEELGLKVLVNMSEKTEAGSGYMNSMAVELEIEGSLNMTRVIEGTVFGRNELRITKIDGYTIELPPGENMLLCNNYDKPGALLKVANRLAASNINIAHFSLGRKAEGKLAMVALVLDTPASEEVLEGLTKFADVTNVQQVNHRSHSSCAYQHMTDVTHEPSKLCVATSPFNSSHYF